MSNHNDLNGHGNRPPQTPLQPLKPLKPTNQVQSAVSSSDLNIGGGGMAGGFRGGKAGDMVRRPDYGPPPGGWTPQPTQPTQPQPGPAQAPVYDLSDPTLIPAGPNPNPQTGGFNYTQADAGNRLFDMQYPDSPQFGGNTDPFGIFGQEGYWTRPDGSQVTPGQIPGITGSGNEDWRQAFSDAGYNYTEGTPAYDPTGAYGAANATAGQAGGNLQTIFEQAQQMMAAGYSAQEVQTMLVNSPDVLGQMRQDYDFLSGQFGGILAGEDALFGANRAQGMKDLEQTQIAERNRLGGSLADSGLGGSAMGVGAQRASESAYKDTLSRATLDWAQQDMDNRLKAGGLYNTAFSAMGGMENTQADRFLRGDIANQTETGLNARFNETSRQVEGEQGLDALNIGLGAAGAQSSLAGVQGNIANNMNNNLIGFGGLGLRANDQANKWTQQGFLNQMGLGAAESSNITGASNILGGSQQMDLNEQQAVQNRLMNDFNMDMTETAMWMPMIVQAMDGGMPYEEAIQLIT